MGINLLREGLDLPEVSLVAVLDADKEGFLRSASSLIQITGRAARHLEGTVIMYADTVTASMRAAIQETDVVLAMHRFGQGASIGRSTLPKERSHAMRLVNTGNSMSAAIFPTNELIASGILERFPRMKVLVAEGGSTWLPYVLQQLDWHVDQVIANAGAHLSMLPSDYARRQLWTCFWYEKIDPTTLELLGEDKVCWQQDYPHPQCTWPLVEQTANYSLEPIKDERLRET